MAISFREFPWYIQFLIFAALAVVIVLAGEYVPYSPVQTVRSDLEQKTADYNALAQEVAQLQVYQRRYGEFKAEMDALQKQLETLKTIVPEDKEVDEFIRMIQGAAAASNVKIRRLSAQAVASKELYFEMPFDVQVDGPYYAILDFFSRMGRLSRIINVGDLTFGGLGDSRSSRYPVRPGTTVTGSFTATTFFTKASDDAQAKASGKAAKKPAATP